MVFALTQLGSFLAGTGTALLVQFYIVPDAETRKRKAQRWEEDVRELSDILATSLMDAAGNAWAAQALYREERDKTGDEYSPAVVDHMARDAEKSTLALGSVIRTQVDWIMCRTIRFNPDDKAIERLKNLNGRYGALQIQVSPPPDRDTRTNEEFEEGWDKEREARETLIDQVQVLEGMSPPMPPRKLPWRRHHQGQNASTQR